MKKESSIYRNGYEWISLSLWLGGLFASAILYLIQELREGALPIFLFSSMVALYCLVDSRIPILSFDKRGLTIYRGLPWFWDKIYLEWNNIGNVKIERVTKNRRIKGGLMIDGIGEVTEEYLSIKLKSPPLPEELHKLRIMRDSYFKKRYQIDSTEEELWINQRPKKGFQHVAESIGNFNSNEQA